MSLAACGGRDLSARELAPQVEAATNAVQSYRFQAQMRAETFGPQDGQHEQGEGDVEGALVVPDRLQVQVRGHRAGTMFPNDTELLFDGERIYQRNDGGIWTSPVGTSQFALLQGVVPSPGEIALWLSRIPPESETSSVELDGEPMFRVEGDWTHRVVGQPFGPQQEGTLEVWIGEDDHLIKQASYSLTRLIQLPPNLGPSTFRTVQQVDVSFYDYNAAIRIDTPRTD